MTDDDPLDLAQVTADDHVIDQLRSLSLEPTDPVVALLRDLLTDVEADLPDEEPVGRGSTVVSLAGERAGDRRLARSGSVVALLTAGIVSLGGMAAASTVQDPSHPLHGLGEAVRAAATAVVDAVTVPSAPAGTAARGVGTSSPAAAATVPAPVAEAAPAPVLPDAAAARSQAALRQVDALLDEAEQLLAAGRAPAAAERLDTAERLLAGVLPDQRPAPGQRLAALRKQLATATAPARRPDSEQRPAQPPARSEAPRPAKQPGHSGQSGQPGPGSGGQSRGEAGREQGKPAPGPEQDEAEPAQDADAGPTSDRLIPETHRSGAQSARLASTKPRA